MIPFLDGLNRAGDGRLAHLALELRAARGFAATFTIFKERVRAGRRQPRLAVAQQVGKNVQGAKLSYAGI
jgi:hypothetical protein